MTARDAILAPVLLACCALDVVNGKRAPWASNPWVAAYSYHLVQPWWRPGK